jgi:hypothetical protein
MIDRLQYEVLNSCADDCELFYFPFAHANFGHQVFSGRSNPDQEPGRFKGDREEWEIRVGGRLVAAAIEELIRVGLLSWKRCGTELDREGPFLDSPISPEEMQVYENYDCVTFEDHIERYGYGPHEFYITPRGVTEIRRPEYDAYDDDAPES